MSEKTLTLREILGFVSEIHERCRKNLNEYYGWNLAYALKYKLIEMIFNDRGVTEFWLLDPPITTFYCEKCEKHGPGYIENRQQRIDVLFDDGVFNYFYCPRCGQKYHIDREFRAVYIQGAMDE